MKVAYLEVTGAVFVEALKGHGGFARRFTVESNALPDDTVLERIEITENPGMVRFRLCSESFADIGDDGKFPTLPPPVCKAVLDNK